MEEAVRVPLLDEVLPGGLRYGNSYLVEFEPQSLWYEASLTLCVQALKRGIRTDYHAFNHIPSDIRSQLRRMGLDVEKLESDDTFRIIDSYSVQTGKGPAERVGKKTTLEWVDLKSMNMDDWNFSTTTVLKSDIPEVDRRRLHIDDNTSVLVQFNDEKSVAEHFRTHTVPFVRHLELAAIHSVASGIFSDSFYRQFETFCDGIIDFRSQESEGTLSHSMRIRVARGVQHDSAWRRMEPSPESEVRLLGKEVLQVAAGSNDGERRLAAIMFTDTVGSTAMAQENESLALQLQEEQRRIVRPLFARSRGREVKTTGDGFLVEFSSALDAVACAVAIQKALNDANSRGAGHGSMVIRIGIHLGDVVHTGSDVAGDAVNVASRIEPLAPPGGICVTAQVHASVLNKVGEEFESLGFPQLKGVSAPIEVLRVKGFGSGSVMPVQAGVVSRGRLAVLPFSNISPDKADEFFSDGMTEEVISSVSRTEGLRVLARTSVMKYKGSEKPISEIGRELGVESVLEGSVRRAGDKVRITVQLVSASDQEPKWSEVYDRELSDIFAIQSDIAQKVASALRLRLTGGHSPGGKPTENTEAYIDYLRGRQAWNRRTEEGLTQAIGFFERSLKKDPNYAKAYTGLADCYATLALLEFVPPNEAYPEAKEAVDKALSLDPLLAEAHASLGLIRFMYDWDWKGSEAELGEAVRLNPSYALAHQYLADYLKAMGRFEEALTEVARARELDPLNLSINTGVGHVLYLSRQFEAAIEQYKMTVDLDPNFAVTHIWFGRPYLEKGMFEEAIAELQTAVRLSGDGTLALAMLGHGLASAGRKEEALRALEKLKERSKMQYVPSYWIAVVYNGFKDKEQTLSWLEKAFVERSSWLVWCNVEPRFDWLRDDPKFTSMMKAMKFPQTRFNR